jgi:Cell wall-active antibiotics response 4TMS YvqF
MRLLRTLLVFELGVYTGLAAGAALAKRALPSRGDEESDEVALVAIFGGRKLRSRSTAFRGGSLLSWFGGIAVDLGEAQLAPECRLRVTSLFGGIAIRVPPGWNVESNVSAIAGGVAVDVPPTSDDAPRLVLEGTAVFGGVAVETKRPEL